MKDISALASKQIKMDAEVKAGRKKLIPLDDIYKGRVAKIPREKECGWCVGRIGRSRISLKKYGEFCSERCARRYLEMHFCDYKGCTNEPFAEVYRFGKDASWSYLCRKHFTQEKKYIEKNGGGWCGAD